MMNEDNTRVHPECIRVSLGLVGQLSYEWIREVSDLCEGVHTGENDPKKLLLTP